jgi:hypothetical protein
MLPSPLKTSPLRLLARAVSRLTGGEGGKSILSSLAGEARGETTRLGKSLALADPVVGVSDRLCAADMVDSLRGELEGEGVAGSAEACRARVVDDRDGEMAFSSAANPDRVDFLVGEEG